MLSAVSSNIQFKYVLADSWFSSVENMNAVFAAGAHFIFALKSNRMVAVLDKYNQPGQFQRIDTLSELEPGRALAVKLNRFSEPVLLVKEVFKNGDGSTAKGIWQ